MDLIPISEIPSDRHHNTRQERLWRLVSVITIAWTFFAGYFFVTGSMLSSYICAVEAMLALLLVVVAYRAPTMRSTVVSLVLTTGITGLVVEAMISGQGQSDTLFFLCCACSFAAYQLGIRAAFGWTIVSVFAVFVTHVWIPEIDPIRVATPLDRLITVFAVPLIIFGLSFFAERSSEQLTKTLCKEKHMAEQLAAVTTVLQERTRLLKLAEKTARVGYWRWDLLTHSLTLSDECRRICGFAANEHVTLDEFLSGFDDDGRAELRAKLKESTRFRCEFAMRAQLTRTQVRRHVLCHGFSEESECEDITAVFGVLKDETESIAAEQQLLEKATKLDQLANFDPLTGLANRNLFQRRLGETITVPSEARRNVGLLLIDLNGFKEINDTMGHPAGDRVLQIVGDRLASVVRDGDTVARLGGDEFTVIVHDFPDENELHQLAEEIREVISEQILVDGKRLFLGASVGAAIFPKHTEKIDELLSFSDTAMYSAKGRGSGFELYDATMTERIVRRRAMEQNLARAWEDEQFHLEFQPQVTYDGQVVGVEALLRWKNGDATVSPMEFIPQMERSDAISKVGNWVLFESCRQAAAWRKQGHPISISVNISPLQFRDPAFTTTVRETLEASGLDGKHLDLELTEGVLVRDLDSTAATLIQLKQLGVTISIDDFGTGYSSLSYLRHLPLDRLKIDRAFVEDIPHQDDGSIAASIIVLARSLGMEVLAEGIETTEQLQFLRKQDCDLYQGYYFSRPLLRDDCEAFLRSQCAVVNPLMG